MEPLLRSPAAWVTLYLLIINLLTLLFYGVDKRRARRGSWRISEKTLFVLPLLGGSVGALLGMRLFRHKTRHWYFRWGIPAILILQLLAAAALWYLTKT